MTKRDSELKSDDSIGLADYQHLIGFSTIGVVVLDLVGSILVSNPSFCDLLGVTSGRLCGKEIRSYFTDESEKLRFDKYLQGLKKQLVLKGTFITEIGSEEGVNSEVRLALHLKSDKNGDPQGFIVSLHDISNNEKRDVELQGMLDNQNKMIDVIREPLWIIQDTSVLHCNLAAMKLTHSKRPRLLEDLLDNLNFLNEPSLTESGNISIDSLEGVSVSFELSESEKAFGKIKLTKTTWSQNHAWLITIQDETQISLLQKQIQKMEKRLLHSKQSKREFLENLSEELVGPLKEISERAENLLGNSPSEKVGIVSTNLNIIRSSCQHLSNIIDSFVVFSKLNQEILSIEKQSINCKELFESLHKSASKQALDKHLKLIFNVEENLDQIHGDPKRLHQILSHLILNSIKSSSDGKIAVTLKKDRDLARFSITDNGSGLSQEQLEGLFQPLSQKSNSVFLNEGIGVGISFAICKSLIELHGGTIKVQSLQSVGSIVSFTIPLESTPEKKERLDAQTTGSSDDLPFNSIPGTNYSHLDTAITEDSCKPLILVVDDERINLLTLGYMLELNGYRVTTASGSLQALEIIQKNRPDLILLDLMMPIMDGFEMCRRVRENFSPNELPILILTAKHNKEDLIAGFQAGANDYLSKPFNREELLSRIKVQLQIRENTQLKEEIIRREKAEAELSRTCYSLAKTLDTGEECIIAFDQNYKVSFFNQRAEKTLGYQIQQFGGRSLGELFTRNISEKLVIELDKLGKDDSTNELQLSFPLTLAKPNGNLKSIKSEITKYVFERELFFVMSLQDSSTSESNKLIGGILAGLEGSQKIGKNPDTGSNDKVQALSGVFNNILKYLSSGGAELVKDPRSDAKTGKINKSALMPESDISLEYRICLVAVMNLSLSYWEKSTLKNKTQFAEESGIWNVSLDGGETFRTRTLDKYLLLGTLPLKPRWKDVVETAQYVLVNCPDQDQNDKNKLEEQLSGLLDLRQKLSMMNEGISIFGKN
ncbi:MAG: response regulator [Proteobacteria bacterium]|nr:response regulator [Pseudomonadota bacterium]